MNIRPVLTDSSGNPVISLSGRTTCRRRRTAATTATGHRCIRRPARVIRRRPPVPAIGDTTTAHRRRRPRDRRAGHHRSAATARRGPGHRPPPASAGQQRRARRRRRRRTGRRRHRPPADRGRAPTPRQHRHATAAAAATPARDRRPAPARRPPPPAAPGLADRQQPGQPDPAAGHRPRPPGPPGRPPRTTALPTLSCADLEPYRGSGRPEQAADRLPGHAATRIYLLDKTLIAGTQIDTATSGQSSQGAGWVVNMTFKSEGYSTWSSYTASHTGTLTAMTLDGQVISAPRISGPITTPGTEISGSFTQASAAALANSLKFGALPLAFDRAESVNVSAELGLEYLKAGLIAGGIGLLLVVIYCLIYYRLLGVITILSLVLSFGLVYAVLVLLGRWVGLQPGHGRRRRSDHRDRHHRRLVRHLLRTNKGRGARGPNIPVRGAARLAAGQADDPVRGRGVVPVGVHPVHRWRSAR